MSDVNEIRQLVSAHPPYFVDRKVADRDIAILHRASKDELDLAVLGLRNGLCFSTPHGPYVQEDSNDVHAVLYKTEGNQSIETMGVPDLSPFYNIILETLKRDTSVMVGQNGGDIASLVATHFHVLKIDKERLPRLEDPSIVENYIVPGYKLLVRAVEAQLVQQLRYLGLSSFEITDPNTLNGYVLPGTVVLRSPIDRPPEEYARLNILIRDLAASLHSQFQNVTICEQNNDPEVHPALRGGKNMRPTWAMSMRRFGDLVTTKMYFSLMRTPTGPMELDDTFICRVTDASSSLIARDLRVREFIETHLCDMLVH